MNTDEFLKQITPAARRSKLLPWLADIQKLRAAGCSLKQVRDFLSGNNVTVAISTLAAFVATHAQQKTPSKVTGNTATGRAAPSSSDTSPLATASQSEADATGNSTAMKTMEQIAAENPELGKKAILDIYSRQFTTSSQNSIARKFGTR